MSELVADQQNCGASDVSFNWVTRTKVQSLVNDDFYRAKEAVSKHLSAIYADHTEKGLVRSGVTLRAGIEVFEEQAGSLVVSLVRNVTQVSRNAKAFDLIAEALDHFLTFLDREFESVLWKVQAEMLEVSRSRTFGESVRRLWSEKRSNIVEKLETHRAEFQAWADRARSTSQQEAENSSTGEPFVDAKPAQICKKCRHWDSLFQAREGGVGLCRRFALAPSLDAWPIAEENDSCEEWAEIGSNEAEDTETRIAGRESVRLRVDFPALLRMPSGDRSGRLTHIYEDGARLEFSDPPPVGAPALLKWGLYEYFCDVSWADSSSCGVTFEKAISRTVIFEMAGKNEQTHGRSADPTKIDQGQKRATRLIKS